MYFQTWEFAILLAAVLAGVQLFRRTRSQHLLLLVASYLFYGWWDVRFLTLIVFSSAIDYSAALGIAGVQLGPRERGRLALSAMLASVVFLAPDWPAFQRTGDPALLLATPEGWQRSGLLIAIVAAAALPALHGLLFGLDEGRRRKAFLMTSLCANLGLLAFFKYYDFFRGNLVGLGSLAGWDVAPPILGIALPVGISFYTFQTMSYTIDVYRGAIEAERSPLRVALYVAYFPQLVAGPILRPQQFLPALDRPIALDGERVRRGFHLALNGLIKKVLIADWVAGPVDIVFSDPEGLPSLALWLATALFAVQIYCDFSGYSDIAIGVSRMLGIEIPLNFDYPYSATSIVDFWRRWHISLSSWLRDYLYIPLGGNRCSTPRVYANLMTTMLLGGLWHGAAWNFVAWGGYQGGLLCVNRASRGWIDRRPWLKGALESRVGTLCRWALTLVLVLIGWAIFRVSSLEHLGIVLKGLIVFDGRLSLSGLGLGEGSAIVALLACAVFVVLHALAWWGRGWARWLDDRSERTAAVLYLILGIALFYAWPPASKPFIYFQF